MFRGRHRAASQGITVALALLLPLVTAGRAATGAVLPDDSTGTIHGRVMGPHGPIAFANAVVVGTRRGAASDSDGAFTITGIPPGIWILRVGAFGNDPVGQFVHVTAGSDTSMVIALSRGASLRRQLHLLSMCDSTRYPWGAGGAGFAGIAAPDTAGWWTASGSIFDFSLPTRFRRRRIWTTDAGVSLWEADSSSVSYNLDSRAGIPDRPLGGAGETECLGGQVAMVELRPESRDRRECVLVYFPDLGLELVGCATSQRERAELLAAFRTIHFHDADSPRSLTGPPAPLAPAKPNQW